MITGLYAGILALFYVGLTFNVIARRRYHGVPFGDKDIPEMRRAIRVHGNFAEYVPLALICIMLLEMQGAGAGMIHFLCGTLLLARVLHAIALTKSNFQLRIAGTMGTQIVMALAGIKLVLHALGN
jgi:uncharacterized membrane protein YecN with MAPEG domain